MSSKNSQEKNTFRLIRPIINSPKHKIAEFLNIQLQTVVEYKSTYILKNPFSFPEIIRWVKAINNFIASFDVKSLFTNFLLIEVINVYIDPLYNLRKPFIRKKNCKIA